MIYKNAFIQTLDQLIYGYIKVKDHKIVKIGSGDYDDDDDKVFDCEKYFMLPGFIDPMIHGGFGHTFTKSSVADFHDYCKKAPLGGVTSFLSAVITSNIDVTKETLKIIASYKNQYGHNFNFPHSKVVGINCEGPFLSEKRKGVHESKYLRKPSIELVKELQEASDNFIMQIAVAIENADLDFAHYLYNQGIVMSLAHSDCTFEDVENFVLNGFLKHCTHLFNGMSPFTHRSPGCVGGCLNFDQILCEIIADGNHTSSPATLELALKIKTARHLCFTTDGTMAAGLPDGKGYKLGNLAIEKKSSKVVLEGTNVLAGSGALMKDLIKVMGNNTSVTLHDLMLMSSYNIAEQLKLNHEIGVIAPNYFADFVLLNENLDLLMTVVNGQIAYDGLYEYK